MNLNFLTNPLIFIILITTISCGTIFDYPEEKEVIDIINTDNWKVTWEENFDGITIDTLSWSKTPRKRSKWNMYMTDNDKCYEVKDGALILYGLVNNFLPNDTAPYLTGGITTENKKTIAHGKVEVRAKIKKVDGAWPAIWMISDTRPWPLGGEIDIMESFSHSNIIQQTVHTFYTLNYQSPLDPEQTSHNYTVKDKSEYNTYGVIISEKEVVLYVNGKITLIYPKIETDKPEQFPFLDEKRLKLSMQLDYSTDPGGGKRFQNQFPAEMHIDWVRFYEKVNDTIPDYVINPTISIN